MFFLRFIAFLTLPALLLGLSGFGGAGAFRGHANAQARLERLKVAQFVALARVETAKSLANPEDHFGKTSVDRLTFASPVVKTIWRIVALLPVLPVPRLAPSLTGIVVLQI